MEMSNRSAAPPKHIAILIFMVEGKNNKSKIELEQYCKNESETERAHEFVSLSNIAI